MIQILSDSQLECLASPACGIVFSAVRALGQATAKEVARKTNRSPSTALYHLGRLESSGLVLIVERRPAARKPEAVYAPTSNRFNLPQDEHTRELRLRAIHAGLRRTMRGWERAVEADADPRHIILTQFRLSSADQFEFQRLLDAAADFARMHETEDGKLLHWSSLVYPDV